MQKLGGREGLCNYVRIVIILISWVIAEEEELMSNVEIIAVGGRRI